MSVANSSFIAILEPYKAQVEHLIKSHLSYFGPDSELKSACAYALLNGGKRFRPALVLMIANALKNEVDVSHAALSVEFFHTASLIADDLPCMDNDDERRNKPTLHKVYGESVALLTTYALISAGYAALAQNAASFATSGHPMAHQSDRLCVLALENASYNTGILGATGGQYLDLAPPDLSLATIREIIDKKTVTLFEISFVFGWIFGGGDLAFLPLVKKSAAHFGMAFQIADDLDDMAQDKAHGQSLNLANACGKESATILFHNELKQFKETLTLLNLSSTEFEAFCDLLSEQVIGVR
ncbi:MAG: polyprenyl synthetase family protein [Candidatus Protochlamydia sp.]|nr:polyprenyl synthetase family protein [Candidatus Protochlamydia sp.]